MVDADQLFPPRGCQRDSLQYGWQLQRICSRLHSVGGVRLRDQRQKSGCHCSRRHSIPRERRKTLSLSSVRCRHCGALASGGAVREYRRAGGKNRIAALVFGIAPEKIPRRWAQIGKIPAPLGVRRHVLKNRRRVLLSPPFLRPEEKGLLLVAVVVIRDVHRPD